MNPQVFAICKILQGDNEHSLPTDKWDDVRYQALQLASLSPNQDFFRPSIDANQRNVNPMVFYWWNQLLILSTLICTNRVKKEKSRMSFLNFCLYPSLKDSQLTLHRSIDIQQT